MARLPDPCDRPWLTVAEVAAITGEGEKVIRAALDAGQLPVLRVGRYVRIPTQRLYDLLGMTPDMSEGAPASAPAATTNRDRLGGRDEHHGTHDPAARRAARAGPAPA